MPLFADGLKKIRRNLELVRDGMRPNLAKIGAFTVEQLEAVNLQRIEDGLKPINGVIVFRGTHLYKSRCIDNGYTIDEVIVQIQSAFCETAEVLHDHSTVTVNRVGRIDSDGNRVRDEAVFECSQQHPAAELLSVVPKGDGRKKTKQ